MIFYKKNLKTFITSVEKSNPGYDWQKSNWDEKTLVGKLFGGVFGIEEFTNMVGDTAYAVKCRFIRSTDAIKEEWKKIEEGVEIKKPKVNGELEKKLTVKASRFSSSAITKIESAGGKAEVI